MTELVPAWQTPTENVAILPAVCVFLCLCLCASDNAYVCMYTCTLDYSDKYIIAYSTLL